MNNNSTNLRNFCVDIQIIRNFPFGILIQTGIVKYLSLSFSNNQSKNLPDSGKEIDNHEKNNE